MIEPTVKSADAAVTPVKKEEGWWETVKVIIEALLIALVVRTVLFQPFNIPSGSLVPTLLVGDYLFVSKYAYGYSHFSLPSFLDLDPSGDARPHLRLRAQARRHHRVQAAERRPDRLHQAADRPARRQDPGHPRSAHHQRRDGSARADRALSDRQSLQQAEEAPQYLETLPGGVQHRIIQIDGDDGTFDNTKVYEVPPGHYFMMGDNRDNSSNSRLSGDQGGVGYVPFENLIGRAEVIFFSIDEGTPAWEVWRWPWTVRWDRIFQRVR